MEQASQQKYTCPMYPEVVKDEPGKCPKCGMTLVLLKDDRIKSAKPPQHISHPGMAAGVLYNQRILLSPAAGAVLMTVSTIVVAINASMLKVKNT